MINNTIYIFDLDGTLANCEHRLHYIEGKSKKKDYDAFYNACGDDRPILANINIMNTLILSGECVWVWTGRRDSVRDITCDWLSKNTFFRANDHNLRMRGSKDRRDDDEVKKEWLLSLSEFDRARINCAFEDRDRVVKMWRENNVTCLQVSYGDF